MLTEEKIEEKKGEGASRGRTCTVEISRMMSQTAVRESKSEQMERASRHAPDWLNAAIAVTRFTSNPQVSVRPSSSRAQNTALVHFSRIRLSHFSSLLPLPPPPSLGLWWVIATPRCLISALGIGFDIHLILTLFWAFLSLKLYFCRGAVSFWRILQCTFIEIPFLGGRYSVTTKNARYRMLDESAVLCGY